MQIVNAVEIHVLRVPGEGGLPHAKVKIGRVDALDGHSTVLLDHIQDGVQMANVPLLHILLLRAEKNTAATLMREIIHSTLDILSTHMAELSIL